MPDRKGPFEPVSPDGRRVVLALSPGGNRTVARVVPVPSRADARSMLRRLERFRDARLPAFASVLNAEDEGRHIRIHEEFLEGFSLEVAAAAIQAHMHVNLALSLIRDAAEGLAQLHAIIGVDGRTTDLVHGHIGRDRLMILPSGLIRWVGFEGAAGDQSADVEGLMDILRYLLTHAVRGVHSTEVIQRLTALQFRTARELSMALRAYLERLDAQDLINKRQNLVRHALAAQPQSPLPAILEEDSVVQLFSLPKADFPSRTVSDEDPTSIQLMNPRPKIDYLVDTLTEHADALMVTPLSEDPTRPPGLSDPLPVDDDHPWALQATTRATLEIEVAPRPKDSDITGPLPGEEDRTEAILRPQAAVPADATVIGDYHVVSSVGRGGMGEIYLGRAIRGEKIGELVALKVLSSAMQSTNDAALDMLLDEARIMARIKHANVLRVVDFGRFEEQCFLATEYLEGRPLVRVMIEGYAQEQGLDYGVIAAIGADAAMGLSAAHNAMLPDGTPLEVVHRDVSPQNIFVCYSGTTKMIDFGVARAVERVAKTAVGFVKGKAAYMSPEQAEGLTVDARSDVFSLGTCLWEMTAGRRLFKREIEFDTLTAVQQAKIEPPTEVRGRPDPDLDQIILGALDRDLVARTQTAEILARQLASYAQSRGADLRHQAVSGLLMRLFSQEAQKERALIRSLEGRGATQDEVEALKAVSGVTQHGGRAITWMADPRGLNALDDFGSTREHVLQAVERINAERAEPLTQVASEDISTSPPFEGELTRPLIERPAAPPPVDPSQARRIRRWMIVLVLLVLGVSGVVAVYNFNHFGKDELAGGVSGGRGSDDGHREHARTSSAVTLEVAPITVFADVDEDVESPDAQALVEEAPRAPASPEDAGVVLTKLERVLRQFRNRGLSVVRSDNRWVLDDELGGTLVVNARTRVRKVRVVNAAPWREAWLFETKARSLVSVGWAGRDRDGQWFVRGLSINDCPARARSRTGGIAIRYGAQEVMVPMGGGTLMDVSVDVPERANRVEVQPFGIVFGKGSIRKGAIRCRSGWWGQRVVLRRLPLGQYALKWEGAFGTKTSTLTLDEGQVRGGEVVRRRPPPG